MNVSFRSNFPSLQGTMKNGAPYVFMDGPAGTQVPAQVINAISGYYLHIEPGKSFLAGGVYKPEPSVLKTIRQEISAFGDEFKAILEKDEFRNYFRVLSVEDKLKKVPQGFEKDDKMSEYLKLKHFIVTHPISDEQLLSENAVKEFAKIFKAMKPLNDFLQTPFI